MPACHTLNALPFQLQAFFSNVPAKRALSFVVISAGVSHSSDSIATNSSSLSFNRVIGHLSLNFDMEIITIYTVGNTLS